MRARGSKARLLLIGLELVIFTRSPMLHSSLVSWACRAKSNQKRAHRGEPSARDAAARDGVAPAGKKRLRRRRRAAGAGAEAHHVFPGRAEVHLQARVLEEALDGDQHRLAHLVGHHLEGETRDERGRGATRDGGGRTLADRGGRR